MQASAFLTILSLSAALNTRLVRFGVVSTAAPLAPSACSRRSASGRISRTGTGDVLGTVVGPFSAHRHLRFQQGLSHATLAQGGVARTSVFMGDSTKGTLLGNLLAPPGPPGSPPVLPADLGGPIQ